MKPIYTTTVIVKGGRTGVATSDDGRLNIPLALQKAFGGEGKNATNPEQLFGAGFAACFETSLRYVASNKKINCTELSVSATISVIAGEAGGFLLEATLGVSIPGLEASLVEELINEAKGICPYHKMASNGIKHTIVIAKQKEQNLG